MKMKLIFMSVILFNCGISFGKPGIELAGQMHVAHFENIIPNQGLTNPVVNFPAPIIVQETPKAQKLVVNGLYVLSVGLGLGYFLKNKNEPLVERALGALGCAFVPTLALNAMVLPYIFIKGYLEKPSN